MSDTTDTASEIRTLVWDIRDLYRDLPDTIAAIAGLHAINYGRAGAPTTADVRLIGGDALALHAHGTDNNVTSSRNGNRDHARDNHPTDPPSVLAVLTRIEDTWRQAQNAPAATTTTVDAAVEYLIANAPWAANNHEELDADLTDLGALRGRIRGVTGRTEPPKPSDAPCITCNGAIVQRYLHGNTPDTRGLDDTRECNRCGKTYTPAQYMLAVQQRLEDVRDDPERLLTASEARTLWRLSEKQIYVWEHRTNPDGTPKITPAGRDQQGRKLYRNGDIATLKGRNYTDGIPPVYSASDGRGVSTVREHG